MPPAKLLPCLAALLVSAAVAAEPAFEPAHVAVVFADGHSVTAAQLRPAAGSEPGTRRLEAPDGAFAVTMHATPYRSADVTYVRTRIDVTNRTDGELSVTEVVAADEPAPAGARVSGNLKGSPIVTDATFCGIEHPLADNVLANGRIRCALTVLQPLRPGETLSVPFVSGTAPAASQLRRAFLAYLEHERPRPYGPFLHHNTWYNLGFGNTFTEADELALIDTVGTRLVRERAVTLDGFVLDDGWDDTHSLWRFHSGWPNGLTRMQQAAARFGAIPGIWLSPWGGYMEAKKARLAAAAPEGFEIRDGSFSLAGPRYYARFRELCASVVRNNGVGYFKFDGIGAKKTGTIDPAAGRDFDAMLRLVAELRQLRPGLYVSQTTGTWASPWWLLHVDNIWRGGYDHSFTGVGSDRQQWITYRDAETFKNVVQRGPLFPLNSLMTHGIIYAKLAKKLGTDPQHDFASEVRSYFGSGTQLQELYLSPELLSAKDWDDLAAAAKWARTHAATLRDTHWIGGDPGKLEVYGWAAWSPAKGVITLRNPSDKPATFVLDAAKAFELPAGAARTYSVTSPYADAPAPVNRLDAAKPVTVSLAPFQVLVLEATPAS